MLKDPTIPKNLDTFNSMSSRIILLVTLMMVAVQFHLSAQNSDTVTILTGIVYDRSFYPVPASHVININTHQGDVTDSLGIFRLPVRHSDTLLIRNIAFQDTLVPVPLISEQKFILIKRKFYPLEEARIFEWGSTYGDFKEAIIEMPNQQTLGESMGLPRQNPDYIPYDMDEKALKSPAFLLTSPVSYFYHNFSKYARSARKVYWLEKNQAKHELFNELVSSENISSITSLTGFELQEFQAYLYPRMVCDFKCTEIQIYTEIYGLWKVYQEQRARY